MCASFAASYGIRLRLAETRMSWREFSAFLANLPGESQLARIISIRTAEGDELNSLSPAQKKLRNDWYVWLNSRTTPEKKLEDSEQLRESLKSMFYERRDQDG
ncbi:MAG: Gp15 family bacteriophage protein [bacterium]